MRKQYKDKRTACALCKPHKRHWSNRWTAKERALISRTDREMKASSVAQTGR